MVYDIISKSFQLLKNLSLSYDAEKYFGVKKFTFTLRKINQIKPYALNHCCIPIQIPYSWLLLIVSMKGFCVCIGETVHQCH